MGKCVLGNSGYTGPWPVPGGSSMSNALFAVLANSPPHIHTLQRAVTGAAIATSTTTSTQTATQKYQFNQAAITTAVPPVPQSLLLNTDMCMYYAIGTPVKTTTTTSSTATVNRRAITTTLTTTTTGVLPCSTSACTGPIASQDSSGKIQRSIYADYSDAFAASSATFWTQFSTAWNKMIRHGQTITKFTCTLNRGTTTCASTTSSANTAAATESGAAEEGNPDVSSSASEPTESTISQSGGVVMTGNSDWYSVAIAGLVLACVSTVTVLVLLVVIFTRTPRSETF